MCFVSRITRETVKSVIGLRYKDFSTDTEHTRAEEQYWPFTCPFWLVLGRGSGWAGRVPAHIVGEGTQELLESQLAALGAKPERQSAGPSKQRLRQSFG